MADEKKELVPATDKEVEAAFNEVCEEMGGKAFFDELADEIMREAEEDEELKKMCEELDKCTNPYERMQVYLKYHPEGIQLN